MLAVLLEACGIYPLTSMVSELGADNSAVTLTSAYGPLLHPVHVEDVQLKRGSKQRKTKEK